MSESGLDQALTGAYAASRRSESQDDHDNDENALVLRSAILQVYGKVSADITSSQELVRESVSSMEDRVSRRIESHLTREHRRVWGSIESLLKEFRDFKEGSEDDFRDLRLALYNTELMVKEDRASRHRLADSINKNSQKVDQTFELGLRDIAIGVCLLLGVMPVILLIMNK